MGADGAIALASRFLACLADVTSNVLGVPSRQGIAEAREMRTTGKKRESSRTKCFKLLFFGRSEFWRSSCGYEKRGEKEASEVMAVVSFSFFSPCLGLVLGCYLKRVLLRYSRL